MAVWKGKDMGKPTRRLAYYITPHGFGHAVRSLEVIRHLLKADPGLHVHIVSDLPDFLVGENVGAQVPMRRKRLDVGLVQRDSLRFDLPATLEAVAALCEDEDALAEEECAFLQEERIDAVVSDVAFIPFLAASRLSIPSIGIGNFTWDWIYETFAREDERWKPLIAWIRRGYGLCGLFLRLPMHGDCSVFPRIRDVPLIARHATRRRDESRRLLGVGPHAKVYLVSFATLDLKEASLRRIEKISHATFLTKRPMQCNLSNGRSLDELSLSYADVVAATDAVITKPGYGIVADCLAHGTPMIYTDRGEFPEYPILVREMEKHLTTVFLPSDELYEGRWEPAVSRMESLPRRSPALRTDGASVCARIILSGT